MLLYYTVCRLLLPAYMSQDLGSSYRKIEDSEFPFVNKSSGANFRLTREGETYRFFSGKCGLELTVDLPRWQRKTASLRVRSTNAETQTGVCGICP